jgi:hypothetical protein
VATNIIEGKTARVGMLVTRGSRYPRDWPPDPLSRLYGVREAGALVPRRWSIR